MSDDLKKITSSSAVEAFEPELGRLLQPTRFFRHPGDVVRDPTLTIAEKRAALSSWASDALPSDPCSLCGGCPDRIMLSGSMT